MSMKKNILIINGPNLNLLGVREPDIYGKQSFEHFFEELSFRNNEVNLDYFQSNVEGEIIDKIQEEGFKVDDLIYASDFKVESENNNLEIVKVDLERHLLLIKGAVPGAPGGNVIVNPAVKAKTVKSEG